MRFLLPLFCIGILLSACGSKVVNAGPQKIALVGPDKEAITLTVEVADELGEQALGLQGRTELAMGEGMLFIFPAPDLLSFWMKDTSIPLDILFFDPLGTVVDTDSMVPCEVASEVEDCPKYTSDYPALYALEVPAGFIDTYGVELGWKIGLPLQ